MANVTAEQLWLGCLYSMEQAGRLLTAGVAQYDSGDDASAVVLTMFGREELGKARILRDMAEKVETGAKQFSAKDVRDACSKHQIKHREAIVTDQISFQGGPLFEAARLKQRSKYGSEDWLKADDVLKAAMKAKRKAAPEKRHALRMQALYVDIADDGSWSRPCLVSPDDARDEVYDACNDYAVDWNNRFAHDAEYKSAGLAAAIKSSGVLPLAPQWPTKEPV